MRVKFLTQLDKETAMRVVFLALGNNGNLWWGLNSPLTNRSETFYPLCHATPWSPLKLTDIRWTPYIIESLNRYSYSIITVPGSKMPFTNTKQTKYHSQCYNYWNRIYLNFNYSALYTLTNHGYANMFNALSQCLMDCTLKQIMS